MGANITERDRNGTFLVGIRKGGSSDINVLNDKEYLVEDKAYKAAKEKVKEGGRESRPNVVCVYELKKIFIL